MPSAPLATAVALLSFALLNAGCATRKAAGQPCTRSSECAAGLACTAGACRSSLAGDEQMLPGFTLTASVSGQLASHASFSIDVEITRIGGLTDPVTISLASPPAGFS